MTAFWDIAPWSLAEVDQNFRSMYFFNHQGDGWTDISEVCTAFIISPDNRGSMQLCNIGLLQTDYMALYPRGLVIFILATLRT
jgi:hypothetical protein